jgi:peptidoglycan/xylan/chitin deacetylase (PgdA/CDA1 family)
LTRLDAKQLRYQLCASKEEIEQHLGLGIKTFCYPYGDYNSRVSDQVHSAGYAAAVTTRFAYDNMRGTVYELPRIGMNRIRQDDPRALRSYFLAAIGGVLPFYQRIKGLLLRSSNRCRI